MIEVSDGGSFAKASRAFKDQVDKVEKSLTDANAQEAEKLKREIVQSAKATLPKRGGLAATVAAMDIAVQKHPNGVRLAVNAKYDITAIDRGQLRHPVYGHAPLVTQSVTPGFMTKPIEDSRPGFEDASRKAMEKIADDIEKKGH